ncbi:MAG: SMI1/KNR4 family protein [Anaerofustis sp.]
MKTDIAYQNEIVKLFHEYADESIINGSISDDRVIEEAQKRLGLKIPEQYLWFLKSFGGGGIAGVRIIGVSKSHILSFVEETLSYRKQGLPENLIVVEDSDEWVECVNADTSQVVTWSAYDEDGVIVAYDSFFEYLIDSFQEAIDNL